ncbi:hypothetical protein SAMN05444506_110114 [Pseudomonas syringae]|nr:hypothetical protein SAMN05444506_110114 [Pseudomonas syringae]
MARIATPALRALSINSDLAAASAGWAKPLQASTLTNAAPTSSTTGTALPSTQPLANEDR